MQEATKMKNSISENEVEKDVINPVEGEAITSEVLELCSLPESFNINQMKEHINNYMASRVQYYREKKELHLSRMNSVNIIPPKLQMA